MVGAHCRSGGGSRGAAGFNGNGKVRTPHEFGCKVSATTSATAPKGGRFVRRSHVDTGFRGHNDANNFRLWISYHFVKAAKKGAGELIGIVLPATKSVQKLHRNPKPEVHPRTQTKTTPRSRARSIARITPRPASQDAARAGTGCPCAAVIRRVSVVAMPAILNPFPNIAMHIM